MALGTVSSLFTPAPYEGVNTNGMWIGLSSPTYADNDFKFIVNLKKTSVVTGATNTSLGSYKFPANPNDGNGYFSPHRILKSYLTNKIYVGVATYSTGASFTQSVWTSEDAQVRYSYQYGFEKTINIPFSALSTAGVNEVTITFTNPHQILASDVIKIVKDNPNSQGYINGIATVVSVTTYTVTANYYNLEPVAGPALPIETDTGYITYISRYTGYVDYSSRGNDYLYAIDAVTPATYSYDEHALYLKTTADIDNNLLTDWIEPRYSYLNEYETVSYISDSQEAANRIDSIRYRMYTIDYPATSSVAITRTVPTLATASNLYRHYQVEVGTKEAQRIFGVDFSDLTGDIVKYYTVELLGPTTSGEPVRGTITRILNRVEPYNKQRMCWLNKMGGWDFFTFTFEPTSKTTINRTELKNLLPFDYNVKYNTGNRQTSVFAMNSETIYTIQTDWVTQTEYYRLKEILESPEVYILDGVDYTRTATATTPVVKVTPVVITYREYESKSLVNDKLFNFKLEYKLAYDKVLHNR